MPKRMLIDASHPEETRVVVIDGNRVEEFDFEAAAKRPLKGNIYLAKVTRVEPSLQAAFVEYGGNRQGFLAFSEIHPDYYQIPVADRMAILQAQTERLMAEEDAESLDAPHTDDFSGTARTRKITKIPAMHCRTMCMRAPRPTRKANRQMMMPQQRAVDLSRSRELKKPKARCGARRPLNRR